MNSRSMRGKDLLAENDFMVMEEVTEHVVDKSECPGFYSAGFDRARNRPPIETAALSLVV